MEMNAQLQPLWTFDEVVAALGGTASVGRMTGNPPAAVCNWKARRLRFPSKYYVAMRDELAARGFSAPCALWGQVGLHNIAA
jgi:hypothetical protein